MAVSALEKAIERFGVPLYVYHEIVHNSWVVKGFELRGVTFVDSINDVPVGARLLFSAHGVEPAVRRAAEKRALLMIDATCPLVKNKQKKVIRYAGEGAAIALIGHAGHDEVVGIIGEAPDVVQLISGPEDIGKLPWTEADRIVVVTQTTLSVDEAQAIIARLRERYPQTELPTGSDICYATQSRQQAVRELAPENDCLLVVGSPNSSNSRRLAEIGESLGLRAMLVDGPDDIDIAAFSDRDRLLVTAGASAPENIVQRCVERLQKYFDATVEERIVAEEHTHFPLPKSLE
jgi:4-hydroxy-3-methylbut-2-enyl diphosphate reductase